jgi:hypothetical protein
VTQTKNRARPEMLEEVLTWRREQLERGGYDRDLAEQLAQSDADLHLAVRLVKRGCSPELAARILL